MILSSNLGFQYYLCPDDSQICTPILTFHLNFDLINICHLKIIYFPNNYFFHLTNIDWVPIMCLTLLRHREYNSEQNISTWISNEQFKHYSSKGYSEFFHLQISFLTILLYVQYMAPFPSASRDSKPRSPPSQYGFSWKPTLSQRLSRSRLFGSCREHQQ